MLCGFASLSVTVCRQIVLPLPVKDIDTTHWAASAEPKGAVLAERAKAGATIIEARNIGVVRASRFGGEEEMD